MFQHVNMRIQNISHPHTAFADVKTNVYNPKMFFPGVKMRVQNVYYRHKAFQVCDTKHLLTSHTLYGYQKACPDRLPSPNSFPTCQYAYTERLTDTHSFSGCRLQSY